MSVNVFPVDAVSGAPSYTGRQLRQLLAVLTGGGAGSRPLIGNSGVNPRTPATTAAASSSTWTVHPHGGYVDAETSAASGGYFYSVDADVTGAVTAANATNPRVDLLYVQISDPAEADGSSVPSAAVGYLAGTAAASPVAPATPARSLPLARINVPAAGGGSPSVSWVAPSMAGAGGIIPVSGVSAYPASPYVGQYVDDAALGLVRWNGTAWVPLAGGAYSHMNKTSAQSIPTSTDTIVTGWVPAAGPNVGMSYSAGVWTIQTPGQYLITGQVGYPSTASPAGQRVGRIKVNGTIVDEHSARPDATFNTPLPVKWGGVLAVGDTVSVSTYQSQGASTGLASAAPELNHVSIVRVAQA